MADESGAGEVAGEAGESAEPTTDVASDDVAKWKAMSRKHEAANTKLMAEVKALKATKDELAAMKAAGVSSEERIASLEAQLGEATKQNARLTSETLRSSIAAKAKLEADDVSLIPLGTEEEMTEAAARLAKRIGRKAVDFDGGARGGAPAQPKTLGEVIRAAKAGSRR